jgi:SET domain-containing protein
MTQHMLMIKTVLGPSTITGAGIGLFADEDVPKDTLVWKYNPVFDLHFDQKTIDLMPEINRQFMLNHAWLSPKSGKYVYSIDDGRFMNHSSIHNNLEEIDIPEDPDTSTVAKRDIKKGEELLINYREIDITDKESDAEYLKS